METYKIYIDGTWVTADEGSNLEVHNPATGELIANVPNGGEKETKEAIEAAHQAFTEWSAVPANIRSGYLRRVYQLMMERQNEIARVMTLEQGKPLKEAIGEVHYAAGFLDWYAEEAKRIYGETIPAWSPNKRLMVLKQPVGVVAAITPWNFPAAMITRKIAPALAAGCTVVLKPASQTPLTAIKLFEIFEEAGIPKGVVNLVTGSAQKIGKALMEDTRVRKLTFTGSTEVGKKLMEQSAQTVKKVSLELGGHAPLIVFEDADLDKAVEGALASKLRNCGQTCISSNRFYVHHKIKEVFIEKLKEKLKDFKVGNGMEEGVEVGPLIDGKSFERIKAQINDAVAKGAKIEFGGKAEHNGITQQGGYFIVPTLLSNVTGEMLVTKEETFGPVIPVITFETDEEVIKMANDTNYGLAAYFFTESLSRSMRVAEKLEFGIIGINDGKTSTPQAPFGGYKESGIGREGGHYGLEEFLEVKYISMEI
ncbi:NAD-dependent succinate-semialdehyde dehydrogenase [Alkaliphilus hydrothermalis]|uniref:Aldehyde dehydrogenase n=1 Tax=Alkaliphilus hydrothermalis TaxID=1482730 RepID=A0ABS2NRU7_9FIRM|nr:NAD-dependent succinate-semialdehyde dehydrogenase [Alkaliphilus hydrothermalis]MBM7615641.1 succinate-semialdehyde dehydrogenase/glutarate-semialdehyde dehydrogenase [Alkaliphilus hydrothermalis]